MANTLTAKIGADLSGLDAGAKKAQDILQNIAKGAKEIREKMQEMGNVSKEQINAFNSVAQSLQSVNVGNLNTAESTDKLQSAFAELGKQYGQMSSTMQNGEIGAMVQQLQAQTAEAKNAASAVTQYLQAQTQTSGKTKSAKAQLMGMTKELTALTIQYRAMSDEEKKSAAGKELAAKMSQIRTQAADLKDTIGDVKQEIAAMASDTSNLDAFNQIIGVSGNALSSLSSTYALVTGDEESFKNALVAFTAVQSTVNTLTALGNVINSSSIAILKVQKLQELAAAAAINVKAAAEGKSIIITKAATVAQRAFNIAANANPYVLLASAIIAATGAMYALYKSFNDAAPQAQKTSAAMEELNKKLTETQQTNRETAVTFSALAEEWQKTKSVAERNEFLTKYREQIKATGLDIKNLQDAEKAFGENGVKNFKEYIRAKIILQQEEIKMNKYAHDLVMNQLKKEKAQRMLALSPTVTSFQKWSKEIQDADAQIKANEKGIERGLQRIGVAQQNYDKALQKINGSNKQNNKGGGNRRTVTTKTDVKFTGVTAAIDKEIANLQQQLKATGKPLEYYAEVKAKLEIKQDEKKTLENQLAKQAQDIKTKISLETAYQNGDIGKISKELKPVSLVITPKLDTEKLQADMAAMSESITAQVNEDLANRRQRDAEALDEQRNAVDSISGSLEQLSGVTAQWAGENNAASVAMLVMSRAIIIAKNAEALANAIASASAVPFPANLAAIATAVASVTAMFAAIPKFAQGGVVGGNSYVSDTTPILAHKGEMLLNNTQQTRLWRLMDSPINGSNTITNGSVKFKIEGQNLVGVLKNYNNKLSRIK